MPVTNHYEVNINLGYYQFFFSDSKIDLRSVNPDCWREGDASRTGVFTSPGIILYRAEDPSVAHLSIDILDLPPASCLLPPAEELKGRSKVIDASIDIPTGELQIDDFPFVQNHTKLIPVQPTCYRVRLSYTFSHNDLEEAFSLSIWQEAYSEVRVLLFNNIA